MRGEVKDEVSSLVKEIHVSLIRVKEEKIAWKSLMLEKNISSANIDALNSALP